jgi:hypothetical protein
VAITVGGEEVLAAAVAPATIGVPATGDPLLDGMLQGRAWAAGAVTYGFLDEAADYAYRYSTRNEPWAAGFAQVSAAQQAVLRAALEGGGGPAVNTYGAVEAFTQLDLVPSGSAAATLRMAQTGLAAMPAWTYSVSEEPRGGDSWFLSYLPSCEFRAPCTCTNSRMRWA